MTNNPTYKKNVALRVAFFLLVSIFFTSFVFASSALASIAGKITAIEGRVDILKTGTVKAEPATVNMTVEVGDIIRTKSHSKAEITFIDNTVLRLASGSRIKIEEYLFDGETRKNGIIKLFRGKARAIVSKAGSNSMSGGGFGFHTPTAVVGVRGTDFVIFQNLSMTGLIVFEGIVDFYNPGLCSSALDSSSACLVAVVTRGQITNIQRGTNPEKPRPATESEINQNKGDTTPTESSSQTKKTVTTASVKSAVAQAVKSDNKDSGNKNTSSSTGQGEASATKVENIASLVTQNPGAATQIMKVVVAQNPTAPVLNRVQNYVQNNNNNTVPDTLVTDQQNLIAGFIASQQDQTDASSPSDTGSGLTDGATGGGGTGATTPAPTDTTAPTITLSGQPALITNLRDASFVVSTDEPSNIEYTLDSTLVQNGNFTNLSEGAHNVVFNATDPSGNTSTTTFSWTTDYTPPDMTLLSIPLSDPVTNTVSLNFASGVNAQYSYKIDGGAWVSISSTDISITSPLVNTVGSHVLRVRATDTAGNISLRDFSWVEIINMNTPSVITVTDPTTGVIVLVFTDNSPNPAGTGGQGGTGGTGGLTDGTGGQGSGGIPLAGWTLLPGTFSAGGALIANTSSLTLGATGTFIGLDTFVGNVSGTYSAPTSNLWNMNSSFLDLANNGMKLLKTRIDGTLWSSSLLHADNTGYFVGSPIIANGQWITGIIIGNVDGTFNPINNTFTSVLTGSLVETTMLMEKAALIPGTPSFADLTNFNIPFADLGIVTLQGNNGNLSLLMNNVVFLKYSTPVNAPPVIWVTNDVTGTFVTNPAIGEFVGLAQSGAGVPFSANATVTHWDATGQNWIIEIANGAGTLNSGVTGAPNITIKFDGVTAGTINNATSTINGTGAGIVGVLP